MTVKSGLGAIGLLLFLSSPAVSARTMRVQEPLSLDLTIDAQAIHFAARGGAAEWRLEVADQQGQEVYDNQETGNGIDWGMVNGQGQAVESGVYSYTLSVRKNDKVHTRKGLLLVQHGNSGYQVRAVSDQQSPVSADGDTAVTVTNNAPAAAAENASGGSTGSIPTNLGTVSFVSGQGFISGTGTTNSMTKWADGPGGVVADTHVTEVNASVVVGDGTFRGNLQIFGPANKDVFAGMGPNLITGPGFNFGYAGESFGQSAGFFNVRPDASAVAPNPSLRFMTANNQRMIINNQGNIGIGIANPAFGRVQIVDADGENGTLQIGSTNLGTLNTIKKINFGDPNFVYIAEEGGDDSMTIQAGAVVNFRTGLVRPTFDNTTSLGDSTHRWTTVFAVNGAINTSDARLKTGVTSVDYGLETVMKLRPVSFEWKDKTDSRRHLGFLAQEVDIVVPEAVYHDQKDPNAPLGMSYSELVPVVVKAVQEQQLDAEQKAARIDKLEAENASLRERLAAVEAQLQQVLNIKKNQ